MPNLRLYSLNAVRRHSAAFFPSPLPQKLKKKEKQYVLINLVKHSFKREELYKFNEIDTCMHDNMLCYIVQLEPPLGWDLNQVLFQIGPRHLSPESSLTKKRHQISIILPNNLSGRER